MKGTTHIAVGIAATAVVVSQIEPNFSFVGMGVALATAYISSLLPDLDHPKAKAHKLAGPLQGVTRWLAKKGLFGSHRTLTHSILGSIPILIASWFLIFWIGGRNSMIPFAENLPYLGVIPYASYLGYVGWGLGIGWLFHLIADSFTVAGVKYFWPFWNRSFGLKLCASDGVWNNTILPILMPIVTILFVFQRFLPGGGVMPFIQSLI